LRLFERRLLQLAGIAEKRRELSQLQRWQNLGFKRLFNRRARPQQFPEIVSQGILNPAENKESLERFLRCCWQW
jgi:hypothetical protein